MELTQHYVLDTNTLIYLLGGRLAAPLPDGRYCVSIITEIELLSCPELSDNDEQRIVKLLQQIETIPLTDDISRKTIQLRRNTNKLKLPDAIIAATAFVKEAILLTNDLAFSACSDLTVQSWALRE